MTIGIANGYPYNLSVPTLQLNEQDYVYASHKTLKGYGRFIEDSSNPPPIEQIPYRDPDPRSWRAGDPGTGVNQAVIQGDFCSGFKETTSSVEATNLAVKSKGAENADYTIGWQSESDPMTMRVVEINNHKDAGQQFFLKKGKASLFLLASAPEGTCPNRLSPKTVHPDNIDIFTDLIVVTLKNGETLEVGPGVYHQPLYPIDKQNEVVAYSIQGSIHNCTTCDFVKELGIDVGMRLQAPKTSDSSHDALFRFLHQYAFFILSAGTVYQAQLDTEDKNKRLQLCLSVQDKIQSNQSTPSSDLSEPVSIKTIKAWLPYLSATADIRYLGILLEKRINWLYSTGRFLISDNTPYLYAVDMLSIAYVIHLYSDKTIPHLMSAIRFGTELFYSSNSPYQRVINQQQALMVTDTRAPL